MTTSADLAEIDALVAGFHLDPHHLLGIHPTEDGDWVVRVRRPDAAKIKLIADGQIRSMARVHDDADLFEIRIGDFPRGGYRLELELRSGERANVGDPYRFGPTLGEFDLHLLATGSHRDLWKALGARPIEHQGVQGVAFAVWAPNARAVRVVGDWNGWDGRINPMRLLGGSGVWELFVPLLEPGAHYKFEVVGADGRLLLRADPMASAAECPPSTASIVARSEHVWADDAWIDARGRRRFDDKLSVYEVHLGSWQQAVDDDGVHRSLTYLEHAERLVDHVDALGFSHVELMPVAEHPYTPSWGYQVSGYYAPTARFGDPDDLRVLIDAFHARGIGVILDWVPAHFPKDEFALARFDGTALYEHDDPRRGEHPDWGTLIFNYGRPEVRNFLVANALYWFEEFHIDGIRVDAVASMLYLDYSREDGEWLPNEHGGRENLEAIGFLQDLNVAVHERFPGALTIAEESTSWGGVTSATDAGGLGFSHKWNMGWMHDTLEYFGKEPVHRKWEHDDLTFGMMYVWTENFVSPLSHDEVVHGKGSLIDRMPGDRWQQMANLRALYGWMWAHPGKQTLFMGCEFAQWAEWDAAGSLDWHVLMGEDHEGMLQLVGELNRTQAEHAALFSSDFDPGGFRWLDGGDREASVYSFVRFAADDLDPDLHPGVSTAPVVVVANLTPVPRPGYRVGLPSDGPWREVLNTDDARFAGSGMTNAPRHAESIPWHGYDHSTPVEVPPLGVVWLTPEMPGPPDGVEH